MGFAFGKLRWTPETFWKSTLYELTTGYAYLIPEDVNKVKPFTDEERAILDRIPND